MGEYSQKRSSPYWKEPHIEKIREYQMSFDDDKLNEQYTLDDDTHDADSDDRDGVDYFDN